MLLTAHYASRNVRCARVQAYPPSGAFHLSAPYLDADRAIFRPVSSGHSCRRGTSAQAATSTSANMATSMAAVLVIYMGASSEQRKATCYRSHPFIIHGCAAVRRSKKKYFSPPAQAPADSRVRRPAAFPVERTGRRRNERSCYSWRSRVCRLDRASANAPGNRGWP